MAPVDTTTVTWIQILSASWTVVTTLIVIVQTVDCAGWPRTLLMLV